MGEMTYFLTGHPPSVNVARRWHWGRRSREAKVWRHASAWGARAALRDSTLAGQFRQVAIEVTFVYTVRRKRDGDNLVASLKPVIDGLVDARILGDDSPEWLPSPPSVVEVVEPKGLAGIHVKVTEL